MAISIKNITENYKERMERLVIMDPLYDLKRKIGKDNNDNPIDYYGLGLLTLLFFFENMLIRNKKAGAAELTKFLYNICQGKYHLSYEDYDRLAREIIQVFRPASGKKNSRNYYNWETGKEEVINYSILKAPAFDGKSKLQYYELADQGLELIFATKEFFSEFQLSINQLILRKQLEKGEFVGALRQIDEMRMDVRKLQEKIYRIKHEIQRNIISDETYKRYETTVEDIHFRLNRENEEFEELKLFIGQTKDRLEYEKHKEKMEKAYMLIIRIDGELGEVHYEHRNLLLESIEMKTTALNAAQESLYYIGIDSFNFKEQITSKLLASPLPLEASKNLVKPFLYLEKREFWSPLTVFAKQGIIRKGVEERGRTFIDPVEEWEIQEDLEIQQKNYGHIMEIVLKVLGSREEITLKEITDHLAKSEERDILKQRYFYDFWLSIHYNSPIDILEGEDKYPLLEKALKLLEKDYSLIEAVEIKGRIVANEKYTIKDMRLTLEVKDSAI